MRRAGRSAPREATRLAAPCSPSLLEEDAPPPPPSVSGAVAAEYDCYVDCTYLSDLDEQEEESVSESDNDADLEFNASQELCVLLW